MMKEDDAKDVYPCPCYKETCADCPKGFDKVLDLQNVGLVVYRQSIEPDKVNQIIVTDGKKINKKTFIFQNTNDGDIASTDFLPEIEKRAVKCLRCRQIMKHVTKILQKVSTISKNEIIGICDYCKLKDYPCGECHGALKNFFEIKNKSKEFVLTKERVRKWLTDVQSEFKDYFVDEKDTGKKNYSRYFEEDQDSGNIRQKAHSEVRIDQLCRGGQERKRELVIKELCRQSEQQGIARPSPTITGKSKKQIFLNLDDDLELMYSTSMMSIERKTKSAVSRTKQPSTWNKEQITIISKNDKVSRKDNRLIEKAHPTAPGIQGRDYYEDDSLPAHYGYDREGTCKEPIDETLLTDFIFSFPFEKKKDDRFKQHKSSSELIGDIYDKIREKNEEIKQKHEAERLKKLEKEERKERARQEKITLAEEKRRLSEEMKLMGKSRNELYKDSYAYDKSQGLPFETTSSTTAQTLRKPKSEFSQEESYSKSKSQVLQSESKDELKGIKSGGKLKSDSDKLLRRRKSDLDSSKIEQKRTKGEPGGESKGRKVEEKDESKHYKSDSKDRKAEGKSESRDYKGESKDRKAERKGESEDYKGESKDRKAEAKGESKDKKAGAKGESKDRKAGAKSDSQDFKAEAKDESKQYGSEPKTAQDVSKSAPMMDESGFKKKTLTQTAAESQSKFKTEFREPAAEPRDQKKEPKDSKQISKEPKAESRQPKAEPKDTETQSKDSKGVPKESKAESKKEYKGELKQPVFQSKDAKSKDAKSGPDSKGTKDVLNTDKPSKVEDKKEKDEISKVEKGAGKDKKEKDVAITHTKTEKDDFRFALSSSKPKEEPTIQHGKDIKTRSPDEPRVPRRQLEAQLEAAPEKKSKKKEKEITNIQMLKPSQDLTVLGLVKIKDGGKKRTLSQIMTQSEIYIHAKEHTHIKGHRCPLCINSDLELEYQCRTKKATEHQEIIAGRSIRPAHIYVECFEEKEEPGVIPLLFQTKFDENTYVEPPIVTDIPEEKKPTLPEDETKGVIRYALSDRTFIEKGWTMLPTEKVVRKMNVYRMRPAHPEFDWFAHNRNKRLMTYDTGERLAEFDDDGHGRWFYRNQRLALQYYDAEELNAQQRFVIYSNGEPDERGRTRPYTILATFDYLGNGIVFDHSGKIRMKYNQTEGIVLDKNIGPVSHWQWHTLNDPPVLQQVMIDTHMAYKDPEIQKLTTSVDKQPKQDNDDMLAIEFDNFVKEKSKKLTQKFKPFQIRMKALKINEHFSLKVLDQANVYLIYRDGTTNIKLNLGMLLDHKEIVDTDTAELGEVASNVERLPARTDSLAAMQKSVAYAQHFERTRTKRELKLRPPEPSASADLLTAALSRPLRPPLRAAPSSTATPGSCYKSMKPKSNFLYYDSRLS